MLRSAGRTVLGTALFVVAVLWAGGAVATVGSAPASATVGVARTFGAGNTSATTSLKATASSASTAGDMLVATVRDRSTTGKLVTVGKVTDSAGNTWTRAASVTEATSNDAEIWYSVAAKSVTSVTVTLSASAALAFTVLDVAGASGTAPLDRTAANAGSNADPAVGPTATTRQTSEIVVSDVGWNSSLTPGNQTPGYTTTALEQSTVANTAAGEQAAWRVLSTAGAASYSATLKSSVAWTALIVTFDVSASSPTPTPTVSSTPTSTPSATPTPTPTPTPPPAAPHVMIVVEGAQSYGGVVGSSNAPYTTGLSKAYRSATNWYAIQHSSQADDLELLAGSSLGYPGGTPYSTPTLVDELHAAGVPWKTYVESLPSNCFNGVSKNGLYDPNHNPFHDFINDSTAPGGWCSTANLGTEGVVAYPGSSGFVKALDAANAPDFVYLVPNDCDEMQGDAIKGSPCAGNSTAKLIKAGDTWLSSNLAPVLTSTWFKQNGIVIITWDQSVASDTSGCCGLSAPGGHIPTIVVTAANKGFGAFATIGDHYGTLRAIEETYGVGLLGSSGPSGNTVNGDLSGAFAGPTTGGISGAVTDITSGTPISGATVSYAGANGDGFTSTDSDGDYTLSGVPSGAYQVSASATGYSQATSSATVTAGTTTTVNLALTSTVGTISGTALDSQTPAEPVTTATISYSGPDGLGSTSTINASTGAFTLTGVPAGTFTITATAIGYGTQTTSGVVVTGGANTPNVDFVMPAASGISGMVSDTEKPAQPVAGATVVYSGTGGSGNTLTASNGAYMLSGVPPGNYSVSVTDNGFTTPAPAAVTVSANQTDSGVNFIVTANSQLSGAVTDSQTPPQLLGGATVQYRGTGTTPGVGSVVTASTGFYTLMGVPPGTYSITASQPGFTASAGQLVTVPPNGTGTAVIALSATSGLSGSAISADTSQPLPDATVTYTGTTGDVARATATTDGDGAYAFAGVSPGTYMVTAAECGYVSPSPETVTVGVGAAASVPGFSLAPVDTTAVCGRVLDSQTSQPIIDAAVTYTDSSNVTGIPTLTDPSGGYTFEGLDPGTYTVAATASGYATASEVVTVVSGSLVVPDLDLESQVQRDPFTQPFTSASIWNTPIGSGAQYEPANLQPATKSTLVSDQHIILMTPTAPQTALDYGPGGQMGNRCTDSGMMVASIPIVAAFTVPTSGMNDPLIAVASDGHTLIQTEPFARCVAGGAATAKGPVVLGDLYGDGQLGGDGGSALSALGGAIRLGELVPGGAINHALQIDIDGANLYHGTAATCYRWPATKCDGYGPGTGTTAYKGTNPQLAMGALLALPQSLDLTTLGLQTEPGMILATALQDYGAYVGNDAARSVNNIVTELGPDGSVVTNFGLPVADGGFGFPFVINGVDGTDPWSEDIATIFAHLDIVTNNGPASIGGGGTPIAPMAAPLG